MDTGLNIDVVEKTMPYYSTGLIHAAIEGHDEIVRMLLDRGADINYRNIENNTALIAAAKGGNVGVVQVLVEEKANLESQDYAGIVVDRLTLRCLLANNFGQLIGQNSSGSPCLFRYSAKRDCFGQIIGQNRWQIIGLKEPILAKINHLGQIISFGQNLVFENFIF